MSLADDVINKPGTILKLTFAEPTEDWRAVGAAELFIKIEQFTVELQKLQVLSDLENETASYIFPKDDHALSLATLSSASFRYGVKPPRFDNHIIAFKYNSPIDVIVRLATGLSAKTVKAGSAAVEFLMCREAINRKKHAEASQEEQKALTMALKNFETGMRALQKIENREAQQKFEKMMVDTVAPLMLSKGPTLHSIEIIETDRKN